MRSKLTIAIVATVFGVSACCAVSNNKISSVTSKNYLNYQFIDPVPASKVVIYCATSNSEKEVYWESQDTKSKRKLLPIQSAQIYVVKIDASGKAGFLTSSISAEKGSYNVIMDYMKYRVEDASDYTGKKIGSGRVGVGLRIKAFLTTHKAHLSLGSISAIGLEASRGNLSGGLSVDVIGIDSESVTNLIPLTSEIDQTSIQSALQALASIKTKLWDDDTEITPHLLAYFQTEPNKGKEIINQLTVYLKTKSGDILRRFWKPDGKNINKENEKKLKDWMASNGLDISPGSITMFIRGAEFEGLRNKAVRDLKLYNE